MSVAVTSAIITARLTKRYKVAENTMAFHFEKPADWTFKAGQFLEITLLDPTETNAESSTCAFSIASAPHESSLMVAIRTRNTGCHRILKSMPLNSEVKIGGPFGNLILHNNTSRPAILLADGIGIAPFRSMLLDAAQRKLPHRVFLFYSNELPEVAPFLDELDALQRQNANYRLVATMKEVEKSHRTWNGEVGPINYQLLNRHLKAVATPDWYNAGPIYYLSGPPQTVHAFQTMLIDSGVDNDDIRIDEFAGY